MCESIPSVTIWGTTQLTTSGTYTTTLSSVVAKDPVVTLFTSTVDGETKVEMITTNPVETVSWTTVMVGQRVFTSVVPQETLYYPCTATTATSSTSASTAAATATLASVGLFTSAATQASSTMPGQFTSGNGATTQTQTGQSAAAVSSTQSQGQSTDRTDSTDLASVSSRTAFIAASTSAATSRASFSGSVPINSTASTMTISSGSSATQITTNSSSDDSSSSSSSSSSGAIAGGILAGIAVLVILALGCRCWAERRKQKKRMREEDSAGDEDDYWERRFRALEAEAYGEVEEGEVQDGPGDEKVDGSGDEWDLKSSRKLHLTLDLASKSLSPRPPSRLSVISTFFASKTGQTSPASETSAGQLQQGGTSRGFNFSRPLRGWRKTFDGSTRSAKSPRLTSGQVSPTPTKRGSIRSNADGSTRAKRESTISHSHFVLPAMSGTAPMSPSQAARQFRRSANLDVDREEMEARRGMEWMRSSHYSAEQSDIEAGPTVDNIAGGGTIYARGPDNRVKTDGRFSDPQIVEISRTAIPMIGLRPPPRARTTRAHFSPESSSSPPAARARHLVPPVQRDSLPAPSKRTSHPLDEEGAEDVIRYRTENSGYMDFATTLASPFGFEVGRCELGIHGETFEDTWNSAIAHKYSLDSSVST